MKIFAHLARCLVVFGAVASAHAAAPVHDWSRSYGGTNFDEATTVAFDPLGNVVLAGDFNGTANVGGSNLVSAGLGDIFLARYDASGAHLWSKRFGGASTDRPIVLAVDGAGNIYLTGLFSGTINFGGAPLVSAGSTDIFLAKFDPSGAHVWSKRFGDTGQDFGWDVAVDAGGNVALAGYYNGTVNLGGANLVSAGGLDIVAGRFDPSGAHLWSQRYGGAAADYGIAVAIDGSGNLILASQSTGTVDFGGGPLTSTGGFDTFLAKFDASGSHLWSKGFGGALGDLPGDVGVDASGNIVLAGGFQSTINFGGGALASAGNFDIFLAMFDPSGAHLWSKGFGDAFDDLPQTLAVDGTGNIAVTGFYANSVDFGGGPLAAVGSQDIYMAKFDGGGSHLWSESFGDSLRDNGNSIAVRGNDVVMVGFFNTTVDFGGGPLPNSGAEDIFLAKFTEQTPVPVLISRFQATPRAGAIELTWNISSDEPVSDFSLLRGRPGARPLLIATVDAHARSYTDGAVEPGATYRYELVVRSASGSEFRSSPATVSMPRAVTSLAQNYPNPFNPRTTIEYSVGNRAPVAIEIFDASGARVRVLDQGMREPGVYRAEWDGHDDVGRQTSSGVYFYRLVGMKSTETRKMVLLK